MAERFVGKGTLSDLSAEMDAGAASQARLNAEVEKRAALEENVEGVERRAAGTRSTLVDATRELEKAISASADALTAEIQAIKTNTAAWEANAVARREALAAVGAGGSGSAMAVAAAAGGHGGGGGGGGGVPMAVGGAGGEEPNRRAAAAYGEQVAANEKAVSRLGATQGEANLRFQSAAAAYSESSLALSRHGALTTEFIQAFSRGQVTLREFESQMVSTMGKFGGWVVAGAAIYGIFDALKHVTAGATETQGAIANLGRFIPGLGGPAGGGRGQVGPAEDQLRSISTQFNVPISDVGDAMQNMARTYKTVSDASAATRAVLAATRLDQVPIAEAQQYLTGISHAEGWWDPGQGQNLVGVMNQLNMIQATYGARVSETLPAVSRAAPMANAFNLPINDLEALAGLGVRAGIGGNQIGTALYRSMATFAFRPSSEMAYREFGVTPQYGQYGKLMEDLMHRIDTRVGAGDAPSGIEMRNIAVALAGPQQARNILPMLLQESMRPGTFDQMRRPTSRSFQEDLDAALSTISERFKSLGIALENFGSQLFSAGIMTPITALLTGLTSLAKVMETAVSPFTSVLSIFMRLPEAVRDVIGAFLLIKGAQAFSGSSLGATARGFAAQIPGMEDVANRPADVVGGAISRMQTGVMPRLANQLDAATGRRLDAETEVQRARVTAQRYSAENAALINAPVAEGAAPSPEQEKALAGQKQRLDRVTKAQASADAAAQEQVELEMQIARVDAQIAVLKNRRLPWDERAAYAAQIGAVAEERLATAATARATAAIEAEAGFTAMSGLPVPISSREAQSRARALEGLPGESPVGVGTAAAATASAAAAAAIATPALASRIEEAGARAVQRISGRSPQDVLGYINSVEQRSPFQQRMMGIGEELGMMTPGQRFANAPRSWFEERYAGSEGARGYAETTGRLISEQTRSALASARNVAMGPWGPMVGMIGSQMLAGAVGNNQVGNFIGGPMATGFTGMMLAQMMGKNLPAGYLIGQTLGSFQQGTGQGVGSLVGGGIGALLGSTVGMTVPGAIIGSTIGNFVGGMFGSKPPSQEDLAKRAKDEADKLLGGGGDIGSQVRASLEVQGATSASLGMPADMGDANKKALEAAQTQARQTVQSMIGTLTAQLTIFGGDSKAGQDAAQQLNAATRAAVASGGDDPAAAQQILQAAQARQAGVQNRFTYMLQTGQGGAAAAAAQTYATIQQGYDDGVTDATKSLADARDQYGQALKTGNDKLISAANDGMARAQKGYAAAVGMRQGYVEIAKLANEQNFAAEYQQAASTDQAQGAYDAAQAGGNRAGQIRAQLTALAAQRNDLASRAANMDPTVVQQAQLQLGTQQAQLQTQMVQVGLQRMQASGAVTEARVPSYDTVGQAKVKLTEAQRQYDYMKQHANAFDPADINTALASVISAKQAVADAAAQYATQMAQANAQLQSARDVGDTVAQAGDNLQGAVAALRHARGPLARQQAMAQVVQQQNAVYEAITSRQDTAYQLAAIAWTGDAGAQARVGMGQASYDLSRARGPDERQAALREMAQARVAIHQAGMQKIQEETALQAATDAGDPVRQARDNLQGARATLQAARGFDEVTQARTAIANAEYQLWQALQSKKQVDLALIQSQHPGDSVAQAQATLNAARQMMAAAKTAVEREQAQTAINNAQYQLHQAQQSRVGAQGSLAEAREWGDGVAQAQTRLSTARRVLSGARGPDERIQAQQGVAQAEEQLHQAQMSRLQAFGQLGEAMHQGDPVEQARIAVSVARATLQAAHGVDEQVQAQTQLASAQWQFHEALMQQIQSTGELVASQTRDPLSQIAARITAARKALASAVGPQETQQAQASLNNLQNEYESQLISQTEGTVDFQLQMQQITTQQAVAQLKALENTADLTTQERQQLQLRIRQLQIGDASSFNLAPGNVKLPTVYDIRRAMSSTLGRATPGVVANASTQVNVYVQDRNDVPYVADAIDRATGSQLSAQLRAAGVY